MARKPPWIRQLLTRAHRPDEGFFQDYRLSAQDGDRSRIVDLEDMIMTISIFFVILNIVGVSMACFAVKTFVRVRVLSRNVKIRTAWLVLSILLSFCISLHVAWAVRLAWMPLSANDIMTAGINILGPLFMLGFARLSLLTARDLLEMRAFEIAASTDPLTGALNRAGLESVTQAWGGTIGVIVADLDHFKRINDRCGHPAGDYVLRSFVERVRMALPSNGHLTRFGGEEFVITLPTADLERTVEIAERIRTVTSHRSFDWYVEAIGLTVSLGVSSASSGADLSQAITRADKALYAAKSAGRNAVRVA